MKSRSAIGRKSLLGLLTLAVVICIVASVTVGLLYQNNITEHYRTQVLDYAYTVAELTNGDLVEGYLNGAEKDAYYTNVDNYLNAIVHHSQLQYYYIFVPLEDEICYLWDTDTGSDETGLGVREAYLPGEREAVMAEFSRTPAKKLTVTNDDVYGYLASAYAPICNSAGEPVALVGADLAMPEIQRDQFRFLLVMVLSIAGVLLVFNGVFYFFIHRTLVDPLSRLNQSAKSMVRNLENGEEVRLDIRTKDEIEDLAGSFSAMYHEIRAYIDRLSKVTAEKERIGAELDIATGIQASMLPSIFPAFPNREEFDVYATMDPAREVGGDFYDFFMIDDRHLAIVMADVSGKGVPAALFMVIGKALIKDHTASSRDPGKVFTEVNDLLCESNSEGMFITAFEGVLDLVTGELLFVNAGHEPPFICRAGERFALQKVRPGFVLAGMEGMQYHTGSIQMAPGDMLFQYTDGVTEATNAENQLFGMERLQQSLDRVSGQDVQSILHAVKADVDAFVGDAPQFDDVTMLCLVYKKRMQG